MKFKLKHILLFVVGLLVPIFAIAGSGIHNAMLPDLFNAPITDQSISYLGQIFGTIGGGLLHSTSGQMLGTMIKTFNYAVFILAGLLLGYTVTHSVINTALDGEFMGREFKSFWIIGRSMGGFAMLVPNTVTGYSILQWTVMWVVLQGVGLADHIWDNALTYLHNSGSVYSAPETVSSDIVKMTGDILASEVCMYKANETMNQPQSTPNNTDTSGLFTVSGDTSAPVINALWNYQSKTVTFPGQVTSDGQMIPPYCGQYSWAVTGNMGTNAQSASTIEQYKLAALREVVLELEPIAKMIVQDNIATPTIPSNPDDVLQIDYSPTQEQIVSAVVGASADYVNLIKPARAEVSGMANSLFAKHYQTMQEEGWLSAGAYYWELISLNDSLNNMSNFKPTQAICAPGANNTDCQDVSKGFPPSVNDAVNKAYGFTSVAVDYDFVTGTGNNDQPNFDVNSGGSGVAKVLLDGLTMGLTTATQNWQQTMSSQADPLISLHNLGSQLMDLVTMTWLIMVGVITGVGLIAGIAAGTSPAATVFNAVIGWIKPLIMALSAGLFLAGAMLAIYLPLIPFIIFTFAVFGWFLYVIEAMVAAPLVAAAITHPQGHDWLGKGTQAMMLLVGAFLRPPLMIIGFIMAMVVSQVAFRLMNFGFAQVITDWSMGSGWLLGTFSIMVLMLIYSSLLVLLEHQCYTYLVSEFPKRILEGWVGAPSTGNQGNPQEALSSAKGMASQGGQMAGEKGGGMAWGAGEAGGKAGGAVGSAANSALTGGDGGGAGGGENAEVNAEDVPPV